MKLNIFWKGFLLSFGITAIFLSNYFFNLTKPIELGRGDTWHAVFTIKHYTEVFESGDLKNILTLRMFAGFSDGLLFSEPFFMHSLIAAPFYFITHNIIFAFNTMVVIVLTSSFFAMFLFARHLTSKTIPSLAAAVIFAFNPFVMAHFPENISYATLMFIPLIFLFFEKSLNMPNNKNTFLIFLFLTLQMISTMTFVVLLSVILPVYAGIRLYQAKVNPRKLINIGTVTGLILFLSVSGGIAYLYNNFYSKQSIGRSLDETELYSPWISDLFFTAPNNLIYGELRESALESIPAFVFNASESGERNLLVGLTVTALFVASFYLVRSSKYRNLWIAFLVISITSFLLSFGPKIRLTLETYIPGPYGLLHTIHPMFKFLRVASRFAVFTNISLAVICSLTLLRIIEISKKQRGIYIAVFILFIVFVEYFNKPWNFAEVSLSAKEGYSQLQKNNDVSTIAEFPFGNLFEGPTYSNYQFVDSIYMFYASTLHSKTILNGYSSYIPPEYSDRVKYLSANFPTKSKLIQLKKWGADGIVLHKEYYNQPAEYERQNKILKGLEVPIIYEGQGSTFYDLKKWDGN